MNKMICLLTALFGLNIAQALPARVGAFVEYRSQEGTGFESPLKVGTLRYEVTAVLPTISPKSPRELTVTITEKFDGEVAARMERTEEEHNYTVEDFKKCNQPTQYKGWHRTGTYEVIMVPAGTFFTCHIKMVGENGNTLDGWHSPQVPGGHVKYSEVLVNSLNKRSYIELTGWSN